LYSCPPNELSTWFVLVADDKCVFFAAKSHTEAIEWVTLINHQLEKNQSVKDLYHLTPQLELINLVQMEINRRLPGLPTPSIEAVVPNSSSSFTESFLSPLHYLQTGWWYLVDILSELCSSEGTNPTVRYQRLIEKQCKDTASQLMLTITARKNDPTNPIQSLLFNNSLHYLVAVGNVFEYQAPCSVTKIELYERPFPMRLFLLSDVLIGTYIQAANESFPYHDPRSGDI
jgi:hypothetical protein